MDDIAYRLGAALDALVISDRRWYSDLPGRRQALKKEYRKTWRRKWLRREES